MKRKAIGISILAFVMLAALGGWLYSRTASFMEQAGVMAGDALSGALGVEVDVGKVEVGSLSELAIHDLTIYDKQANRIARADLARVGFRLFSSLEDLSEPSRVVKEITLSGVEAELVEREDRSWNVADLASSGTGETAFHGTIRLEDARVTVRARGREVVLTDVAGTADCADYPVIKAEVAASCEGAALEATGTYRKERQILNVAVRDAELSAFLPLLPDGILPEGVTVEGGHVSEAHIAGQYYGSVLSYTGDAAFDEGRAVVLGTKVEHIAGTAAFTDAEALLHASAEAAGQKASVRGKVLMSGGEPLLQLVASSDAFDPSAIRTDLPYAGAAAFTASITGAASDPTVDGTVQVGAGAVMDIPFSAASAHVRYHGGHVYVEDLHASALGGEVSGEAALAAGDLSYTAHARAAGVDLAALHSYFPETADLAGRVSLDVGASGVGTETAGRKVYGSVELAGGSYKQLPIERANASLYLDGDSLRIDYASLRLPNGTSLGLEGTVEDGHRLDLAFYGGHVDLSLVQTLVPEADMTGLGDFAGTVHGDAENPQVDFKFTASNGTLFKQPFDSVRLKAGGSLAGLVIEDFSLMHGGKQRWYVDGSVGLAGERRIDLRVDTVGVRAENLAALVAPDEPITGNVDNTIRFTGTLDNPHAVGYIHFYRGSYQGVLLSGMDGDYTLEDGILRLQDFHIFSPWVDVDVNGTVNRAGALDIDAQIHEIDMARVASKFPYPVSGTGVFAGHVGGTLKAPTFQGLLRAQSVTLNDQEITNLSGNLDYDAGALRLSQLAFQQGEGTWELEASVDLNSHAMAGEVFIDSADLSALCAILNQKNDMIEGRLSGKATIGGTYDSPAFTAEASVAQGTVAGYDVHDMNVRAHMDGGVLYLDSLEGKQGGSGTLSATGSAAVGSGTAGRLQGSLHAESLALGIFAKAGGIATPVTGTADLDAKLGGTLGNPSADVTLLARDGGFGGAAFDRMEGDLALKNGLITVDSLRVQKSIDGKSYEASAKGVVPLRALTAKSTEELDDYERIRLTVSLGNADLSLLPVLSKQVDWAMGATNGEIEITGTLAHPFANGSIVVPEGAMKLSFLETPITDMVMRLDFHDNVMTVREFSGKMGSGTYAANGEIVLDGLTPSHYEGSFVAQGLDVRSEFFRGPIDAAVKVSETEVFGRRMPLLSGSLNLHDCVISVPTIPDTSGDLPALALDFDVNAGDRVHAYSSHLYDMYLKGQAHFGGTMAHPKTQGTISVRRGGTVTYLKNVFSVREGAAYFNQFDTFLPSISFFADTRLSRTRVFLSLKGRLDAMEFGLTSSPEMSQEEILRMLTLRNDYGNGESALSAEDILVAGLQMSVLADVEDTVKNLLLLDRFTVSSGNGSLFSTTESESKSDRDLYHVEMGKYLSDKVMLRYSQGIAGDSTSRVGVQYDFDDRYGISFDKENGGYVVGAEIRIRF